MPTLDSLNAMADWQWMPTEGRSARDINMENALYERERRRREPQQFRTVLPFTEWDPFFGGLARTKDAAEAAGMRFAVDWRGFGRPEGETSMPTSRTGVLPGANYATEADLADARQQQLRDYGVRQLAAATGAAEDKARAVNQAVEDPMDLDRAAANARLTPGFDQLPPDQQRQRIMAMTPYHLRAGLEQQFAAQDLKERQQAEIERANQAKEGLEKSKFQATYGAGTDENGQKIASPLARQIAEYRLPPISPARQQTPEGQAIMAQVQSLNPDYDGTQFAARNSMRKAFTSGSQGQSLNALNTAIEHLDQFKTAAEALGNGPYQPVNAIVNWAKTVGGDSAPTNFEGIKTIMAGELAAAFKKSGATDEEIKQVKASIEGKQSTNQLVDYVTKEAIPALGSKAHTYQSQWEQTMGKSPFDVYTPGARAVLEKYGAAPKGGAAAAPATQRREIPGHPGTFAEFRDGKWVRVQ